MHQQTYTVFSILLSCTMYCTFHCVLLCIPSTLLFTVYFHTAIFMICFLCYWSHLKANAVNQTIQFVFFKDLPSITQPNVQVATAENEEQYPWVTYCTLNYKIAAFFLEVYFERGVPEMNTNQLKDICNEVHFLTKLQAEGLPLYQKHASQLVFSKIFVQIFSYLKRVFRIFISFCFPENLLVAAANRCKVLKIFIPIKVTAYM